MSVAEKQGATALLNAIRAEYDLAAEKLRVDVDMRRATILFVALLALALPAFGPSVVDMAGVWASSDTFSYGFFIAPIAIWLVWRERHRLRDLRPRPAVLGAAAFAVGMAGWLAAHLAGVAVIEQLAAISLIPSAVLAAYGWPAIRVFWFPLFFLVFMAPFGEFLIPPLQDFTAEFIVSWLRWIGIPVFVDGIFIYIPTGSFKVAEACAGLNFLIATVVISSLFAYLSFKNWRKAALFLAIAFAVPIIANGFRALGIVLLAYVTNHKVAVGVDHIVYGFVFLALVTIMVLAIGFYLSRNEPADGPAVKAAAPTPRAASITPARFAVVGALAAAVLIGGPVVAWRATLPPPDVSIALTPIDAPGWTLVDGVDDGFRPEYAGADAEAYWSYRSEDGDVIDVYVAYYLYERDGAEAVNSLNLPYDEYEDEPEWDRVGGALAVFDHGGEAFSAGALDLINRAGGRREAWSLYWVGGGLYGSPTKAKLGGLKAVVSGGERAAAAIVVSARHGGDPQDADAAMRRFLNAASPLSTSLSTAKIANTDQGL